MENKKAEDLKKADKALAKKAWALVWNRKTPFFATLGIAIVFTLRPFLCEYEKPFPAGLSFKWYGEYCGPGYGGSGAQAVDELDEACQEHDNAYEQASD